MTTHNIFTKLANRMVGAMMVHTQLTTVRSNNTLTVGTIVQPSEVYIKYKK